MWYRYVLRENADRGWDRNRGSRGTTSERGRDPDDDGRAVFVRDLDLPHGRDRELVRHRDRVYEINGADSRVNS